MRTDEVLDLVDGLVSIITPLYNAEVFIEDTAHSVFQQTYENWEWVVVDDGSTDRSVEIVQGLAEGEPRIRLFRQPENRGVIAARNRAIALSRGQYVTFLDSDDLYFPDKLERQVRFMRERNLAFSSASYHRMTEDGVLSETMIESPLVVGYHDVLRTNSISCLCAFIDQKKIGKHYMPDAWLKEDIATWVSILKKGYRAWSIRDSLAAYRVRSHSASRNKTRVAWWQWRYYRDTEKLGLPAAMYYMAHYTWHGFWRNRD